MTDRIILCSWHIHIGNIYSHNIEIKNVTEATAAAAKSLSCVRLCATPWMAAHQAPPSLEFSKQEHWSGLSFPSPMHESEKWKGSRSVMSDSSRPHGLQPTRLLCPWDSPGKNTGVGSHALLQGNLPNPEIKPTSLMFPVLLADSLPSEPPGKL